MERKLLYLGLFVFLVLARVSQWTGSVEVGSAPVSANLVTQASEIKRAQQANIQGWREFRDEVKYLKELPDRKTLKELQHGH